MSYFFESRQGGGSWCGLGGGSQDGSKEVGGLGRVDVSLTGTRFNLGIHLYEAISVKIVRRLANQEVLSSTDSTQSLLSAVFFDVSGVQRPACQTIPPQQRPK